jgi:hypothetical protein
MLNLVKQTSMFLRKANDIEGFFLCIQDPYLVEPCVLSFQRMFSIVTKIHCK